MPKKNTINIPPPPISPPPDQKPPTTVYVFYDGENGELLFELNRQKIKVPYENKGEFTNETLKKILSDYKEDDEKKQIIKGWLSELDDVRPFYATGFKISPSSSKTQKLTAKGSKTRKSLAKGEGGNSGKRGSAGDQKISKVGTSNAGDRNKSRVNSDPSKPRLDESTKMGNVARLREKFEGGTKSKTHKMKNSPNIKPGSVEGMVSIIEKKKQEINETPKVENKALKNAQGEASISQRELEVTLKPIPRNRKRPRHIEFRDKDYTIVAFVDRNKKTFTEHELLNILKDKGNKLKSKTSKGKTADQIKKMWGDNIKFKVEDFEIPSSSSNTQELTSKKRDKKQIKKTMTVSADFASRLRKNEGEQDKGVDSNIRLKATDIKSESKIFSESVNKKFSSRKASTVLAIGGPTPQTISQGNYLKLDYNNPIVKGKLSENIFSGVADENVKKILLQFSGISGMKLSCVDKIEAQLKHELSNVPERDKIIEFWIKKIQDSSSGVYLGSQSSLGNVDIDYNNFGQVTQLTTSQEDQEIAKKMMDKYLANNTEGPILITTDSETMLEGVIKSLEAFKEANDYLPPVRFETNCQQCNEKIEELNGSMRDGGYRPRGGKFGG